MIRSMTGFGRSEAEAHGVRFRVEIKSVNHRFFNANLRLPREFDHLERRLEATCSSRIERGHLSVQLELERSGSAAGGGPTLERDTLDRYLEIVESLESLPGVTKRISVEGLLALPGVVEWASGSAGLDDEAFLEGAGRALEDALEELLAAREEEGAAIEADLRGRLAAIDEQRERIVALLPEREARERERLRTKVAELLEDPEEASESRIAQEVILYADRVDVSEELTRLAAHLERFHEELEGDGAVGRKLTFLLQELHREANTIGAKANDAEIQQASVEIRAEIERMREQAENVE
ncbi:MAG: YicC/YloC family endoribonuclease [Gemmatimonadota bacterium]|nr:YicC/YloC family endoribonuclease [Gemmatimonadota bacterium]